MRTVVLLCGLCAVGCGVRVTTLPGTDKKTEPEQNSGNPQTVQPRLFDLRDTTSSVRWLADTIKPIAFLPPDNRSAIQKAEEELSALATKSTEKHLVEWPVTVERVEAQGMIYIKHPSEEISNGKEKRRVQIRFTSPGVTTTPTFAAAEPFAKSLRPGSVVVLSGRIQQIQVYRAVPNFAGLEDFVEVHVIFALDPVLKPRGSRS